MLDHTSPISFQVDYRDSLNVIIDNTTGSCLLNFSSPLSNQIPLNYSSGFYQGNISYSDESKGNAFELVCLNSANNSQDHSFANDNGTVTFQYNVYEPLIVDVYSAEEIGQNISNARLSGRAETLFLLLRNITGNGVPTNVTGAICNISLHSRLRPTTTIGFEDYYTARYILPSTGNLSLTGTCLSNDQTYTSEAKNLSVEALLIPSNQDLGNGYFFEQPLLLVDNGSDSFIAHSGYQSGVYAPLQVTLLYPSTANLLSQSYESWEGRLGFVDLFNTKELSLINTNLDTNGDNIFSDSINGFSSAENLLAINGFSRPTLVLMDQASNGRTDILVSGQKLGSQNTTRLLNHGTTFNDAPAGISNLEFASICYGDFNTDTQYDLFVSGQNASGIESSLYLQNGSAYQSNWTAQTRLYKSTCALGRFISEDTTSLLHFGTNSTTSPDDPNNWKYVIYNDTRNWSKTTNTLLPDFNGSIYGDSVIADFNGDGFSDIILCGGTSGNEILLFYVNDLNASGEFVKVDPFTQNYAVPECSLSAADYDFDGDLDLAYTGIGSGQPIQLFNNKLASVFTNSAPQAPSYVSGEWNESTSELWVNWSMGSDDRTPAIALSYNLEIESLSGDLLLSGQPAVSSKPFQGYLGNMQYRLNFTLYNRTPQNVFVRIQSIDTSLQKSSWTEQIVLIEGCEPKQSWNITTPAGCNLPRSIENNSLIRIQNGSTLTITQQTDLGTNSSILVENGTLIITAPITGNTSSIFISPNGNTSDTGLQITGIDFSINRYEIFADSQFDHFESNSSIQFVNTTWDTINTSALIDVRYYLDLNFTNQFGKALSNVSIFNESSFLSNNSGINLTALKINASGNQSASHNISFYLLGHYNQTTAITLADNARLNITLNENPTPQTGNFSIGNLPIAQGINYSEDFASFSSVENLSIHRAEVGIIHFTQITNISFVNLTEAVSIQQHSIYINETQAPGLNRPALLEFKNLSFQVEPTVLRNGVICESCSNHSYNGSSFNVSVTGFSNYSLTNNSKLELLTPSVLFNATDSAFSILYYEYGNVSANIQGADCSVTIGSNTSLLSFNGINHSKNLYFNVTGTVSANVSCYGNSSYEPLNRSYTLNVVRNGAYFLKDSDYTGLVYPSAIFGNLSGFSRFWITGANSLSGSTTGEFSIPTGFTLNNAPNLENAILADLNNDGWNDLFIMSADISLNWWDNLTTQHDLNVSLKNGDAEVLDYDFDGDLDILACGFNSSSLPQTLLLENQLADRDYLSGAIFESVGHNLSHLQDCNLATSKSPNGHWIVSAGTSSLESDLFQTYIANRSGISLLQNFEPFHSPHVEFLLNDINEDGIIDLIISGNRNGNENTSFYVGTGENFTPSSELSSQLTDFGHFYTSIAIGRFTNETNQSLIFSGISNSSIQALAYGFNGSHFVEQDLVLDLDPVAYGFLTLGDIDSDSDLDLLISGQSATEPITQLYTSTLAQFAGVDTQPTAPAILGTNYNAGILNINWSNGSDTETPNTLLSYSLRVGSIQHPNQFHSGLHSQTGNQGHRHSALLSLPDACFGIQVQSIDASFQTSNWSELTYTNNHSEICNGYDNDCDGLTDEDFLYPGTNLFIYDGSLNSTPFTCSFYETYAPENLSCPNAPTLSPSMPCQTNTHNGAVYAWNSTTKTCDCELSSATIKNVQIDSNRGGGGSFAPSQQTSPITTETEEPEEVARPPPENEISSSSSSKPTKNYFTTTLEGFEVRTEVTHRDGNTYIKNEIRNTDRTPKTDIVLEVEFKQSLLKSLGTLRSLNSFERNGQFISFEIDALDYLEETTLLYSLSGIHSLDTIAKSALTFTSKDEFSAAELAQLTATKAAFAEDSIRTNVTESVIDNRTVIRLDVDLKENVTEVHGIEIEQEIPKCLIEEITDSILEAAIDPALLQHVEIKEADPLLVWRFDRLEDAVNLELTLDTLRSADCEDEVTLELLAKSFIYQNQPINKLSVILVLILSVALVALTLSPVLLSESHRFHRHDNPHVLRLAKIIVRRFHKGVSQQEVIQDLVHNDETMPDIDAALDHVQMHQPSHTGLTLYEHRVEIALFFSVLVLSLMELGGVLPGYLDWFKKVLSWAIMLLVVHHANLARLFFNEEDQGFSVSLMLGMFLMHLVHLAEFATEGLSESVGFVFDWYVMIVRYNDTIHLSWLFFTTGLLILIGCAFYATRKLPIRERSLGSVFFENPTTSGWRVPLRAVGLFVLFVIFFFSIFNRLIEWLAIAVDSALFVVTTIVLLALILSMLAHHRGHRARHFREIIWETLADNYLIALGIALGLLALLRPFFPPWFATWSLIGIVFVVLLTLVFVIFKLRKLHELSELERIPLALDHLYEKFIRLLRYPRTLVLALAGLPVLQLVVESALTIIPNITGEASHLYGASDVTLLSLTGQSGLISQQLFLMQAHEAVLYAFAYLASFLGLISLLLTPVWIWALVFRNRGHGMASGSIGTWLYGHSNWTQRLGSLLISAGLPLGVFYVSHPLLRVETLSNLGSAGVRFVPQVLELRPTEALIALIVLILAIGLLTVPLRWQRSRSVVIYGSTAGSVCILVFIYFVPYVQSLGSEVIALLQAGWSHSAFFSSLTILLALLQATDLIVVYLIGGGCFVFLALPLALKKSLLKTCSHWLVLRRITELSSNTHLLEYYDEARVRFAGNLVHHLRHYMQQCERQGLPHAQQIRLIRQHGYPSKLISRAQTKTI